MCATDIKTGSMRNPVFDSFFIFLPLAVAIVCAIFLKNDPTQTYLAIAGVFWIASNTHAFMTYVKAMWDQPSRKKYMPFFTWIPLLIFISCVSIWSLAGGAALVSIYYYTQLFHYVRQSYGLGGIYRKCSNDTTPSWLHQSIIYMFPFWALLLSMHHGFSFFKFEVYSFSIGIPLITIFGLATSMVVLIWLGHQIKNVIQRTFSMWYFLYVITHFIVFYIGLIYFEDKTQGWACMAFWHGIQYVLFVWNHFERISGKDAEGKITLFKPVAKNVVLFTLVCGITSSGTIYLIKILLSGAFIWAVPVFFTFTLMLNFNHYLLDAIIWRRPKQKEKVAKQT
ncbi:MAG: hypothetical protein HRT94_04365 [Alphaproteobacteria bacterium]|nr:hypothetical protein [Alphaproteobacteria bacterium]